MSRGPYPILLVLAMSLPGAARAVGLGEIHVDSALNEPLSAQIDIVGATRDDLAMLTAKIANREIFQRYGADRPSFLNSATFKVGLNAQGHPVLSVRSAEAFTDPVVSFLVDLHYGNGELIREYSLLLDPASFAQARAETAAAVVQTHADAPAADSTPRAIAPATAPSARAAAGREPKRRSAVAADTPPPESITGAQHRVAAKDTLRGIARRLGARTESQAQRLMMAIFRANPDAFDGNINLLHLGAVLNIPSAEAVNAIDAAAARKEVRAQMTAWRLDGRPATARRTAANAAAHTGHLAAVAQTPAPASTVTDGRASAAADAASESLKSRVASLEQELDTMRQQLTQSSGHTGAAQAPGAAPAMTAAASAAAAPQASIPSSPHAAQPAPATPQVQVMRKTPPVAAPVAATAKASTTDGHGTLIGAVAASLGVLLGGFAFMRRRTTRNKASIDMGLAAMANDAARTSSVAATAPTADAAPQSRPAQSQRITVREIPDPPIVGEIKQRESLEASDQNMFIDTEALERSYLDSLGIDTFGLKEHTQEHPARHHGGDDLSADSADNTQELPEHDSSLDDTASLQHSNSFDTVSHVIARESSNEATGTREATGLDTVAIDPADLEAELRHADPNTVVLDTLQEPEEKEEVNGDTVDHPLPPRVSLTGSNPIAIDATPPGATALDYDLLNLDATAQHVQMPSDLHAQVVVSERRTNIVDVLRQAIERDPQRRDLRMKLLETYYSAASTNQKAFLEVVRKLARDRDFLSGDDWKKVMMMGRDIAAEDILFADPVKDDDLADCA